MFWRNCIRTPALTLRQASALLASTEQLMPDTGNMPNERASQCHRLAACAHTGADASPPSGTSA